MRRLFAVIHRIVSHTTLGSLLVGVCMMAVPAWGGRCAKQPACTTHPDTIRVTVQFDQAHPFIDGRRSKRWIRRRASGRIQGAHPVGLTETQLVHKMAATFTVCSSTADPRQCVYLSEVTLTVAYTDTKVYIAHEYPPGSCEYQAIYRHEADHVRILNSHQARFLPMLRADLRALVRTLRPASSHRTHHAQKKIMRHLERLMRKKFRRLERSLSKAHAAIDTQANYTQVQSQCRNW